MAASVVFLQRCCQRSPRLLVARRQCSSSPATPSTPLHKRLLLFLTNRFYDIELLFRWRAAFSQRELQSRNAYYGYTQRFHGSDIAAAYYVLRMRGGFKFVGHTDWFRTDRRGKFNWDFLKHKDTPLEEVDMSYSVINYTGIDNLEGQKSLRTLSLRGCPEVDDWCLARLHVFQDSLEKLDISHCPRITTGGLVALRNLKGLRHLDVSFLPGISNHGLLVILLEEMLPKCHIVASGYDFGLKQEVGEEAEYMQSQK